MGPHAAAGCSRESEAMEGKQLQPAGHRCCITVRAAPPARVRSRSRAPHQAGFVMLKRSRIVNRLAALRRESIASARIPCTAHVAPNVVKTSFGDYLQV